MLTDRRALFSIVVFEQNGTRTENHPQGNARVGPHPAHRLLRRYKCAPSFVIDADRWGDEVCPSDLEQAYLQGMRSPRRRPTDASTYGSQFETPSNTALTVGSVFFDLCIPMNGGVLRFRKLIVDQERAHVLEVTGKVLAIVV